MGHGRKMRRIAPMVALSLVFSIATAHSVFCENEIPDPLRDPNSPRDEYPGIVQKQTDQPQNTFPIGISPVMQDNSPRPQVPTTDSSSPSWNKELRAPWYWYLKEGNVHASKDLGKKK